MDVEDDGRSLLLLYCIRRVTVSQRQQEESGKYFFSFISLIGLCFEYFANVVVVALMSVVVVIIKEVALLLLLQ